MRTKLILVIFTLLSVFFVNAQIPDKPEDISPLLIGEKLPDIVLLDNQGDSTNIKTQISSKKTVLVFYRGGWCPYCNIQLSGLAESEEEIVKLGYQIMAVSPDDYRNLKPTIGKGNIKYQVFSDPKGKYIQEMGIAFSTSQKTENYISKKTIGNTTETLPVPSVFVIDTNGEILFEYICPNYKKRISSEFLLAVLENLD